MKISEYIKALQAIAEEHGDLEVNAYSFGLTRIEARPPEIAYKKILKKRESRDEFYGIYHEKEQKGEKVCRI